MINNDELKMLKKIIDELGLDEDIGHEKTQSSNYDSMKDDPIVDKSPSIFSNAPYY
jgi:hypothetical protein